MPLNFGEIIDKGSVNLIYDHLFFSYDDFRDVRTTTAAAPRRTTVVEEEDVAPGPPPP